MKWTRKCGERLRKLRKMRGVTLGQLARATKWTTTTLSSFERAQESPTKDDLYGLAGVLCVSWEYLAGLRTTEPPEYTINLDAVVPHPDDDEPPTPTLHDVYLAEKRRDQDAEAAAKVDAYIRQERRDKFARAALTGILANLKGAGSDNGVITYKMASTIATSAWTVSDEMVVEGDKEVEDDP